MRSVIVIGGGGDGAFLFVLLTFLAVPFLFLALPFLLLRGAARRSVHVVTPFGWSSRRWDPAPVAPSSGWQAPEEPVLPPVHRADVESLVYRLAHDVRSLDAGGDAVARQALADASERHSTASTLLERASSDAQLRTAWMTAVEGLTASRVARAQLGLPLGAPLPQLQGAGPTLTRPTTVEVGGRTRSGSPTYEPGRAHWFPGGYYGGGYVPGGWYDAPFWPAGLVLGGLAGGLAMGGLAGAVFADDLGGGDLGGGDLGGGDLGGDWAGGLGGGGTWDDAGSGSDAGWDAVGRDGGWDSGGDGFGGFGGGGDWGGDGGDGGGGE